MKKQKVVLRSAQELANQIEAKNKRAATITPEQAVAELKAKYPDDSKVIDEKVIDVRQNKVEAEPKSEKSKAEPKPKKEKGPTMAGVMDTLMQKGGKWDELLQAVQAEGTRLGLTSKVTKGTLRGHFTFRQKTAEWAKNLQATDEGITVKQA